MPSDDGLETECLLDIAIQTFHNECVLLDRVDKLHVESGDGLHKGKPGMQALLRSKVRRAVSRCARPSFRAGIRSQTVA